MSLPTTQLTPLSRDFYRRDPHRVAKELLGKVVVRRWRNELLMGRITETESYVGEDDLACHASKGRTARTEVMYGDAGHAYVYLIYGMYEMLNFVVERPDFPAAVLVRSLEPLAGVEAMQRARGTGRLQNLTTGPGKLCAALRITRALNGEDLTRSARLFLIDDGYSVDLRRALLTTPRIGVEYAGAHAALPWRYVLKGSEFVSGRKAESRKRNAEPR